MLPKRPECDGCSLEHSGKGFVPDSGIPQMATLWGEAPGKNEIEKGEPFIGAAGWVLRNWMLPAASHIDQKQCKFMNVLRCLPKEVRGRAYPQGDDRRIAETQCRVYDGDTGTCPQVLCGEFPQRLHFSEELRQEDIIDKSRGREVKGVLGRMGRVIEKNGKRYAFWPHPSWVYRNPWTIEAAQECVRITFNEPKWVQAEYVPWEKAESILSSYEHPIGIDMEWSGDSITVIGLAWDGGRKATHLSPSQAAAVLSKQNEFVGHNILDADFPMLVKNALPVPSRAFDTRPAMYVSYSHLAGTGLFDLRSCVLIAGRQGSERYVLDFKRYHEDLYGTCRDDAASALFASVNLKRRIEAYKLDKTFDLCQRVIPIFEQMHQRGIRMDMQVLEQIHEHRKSDTARRVVEYGLTETRGKKKLKQVPIWRSPKVLDKFESLFGVRPEANQTKVWAALAKDKKLSEEAREFAENMATLKKGANDAAWLGKVTESDDGLDFGKIADGHIHPRYDACGSPDRPVASGPNINFPRVSDDPRPVPLRAAVLPPEDGMLFCSVDFSSVESLTTPIEMGDAKRLADVQRLGKKFHDYTAELVGKALGLTLTRQQGKTINHELDKGGSAWNLASRLLGSKTRKNVMLCARIHHELLKNYPVTAAYREELYEKCRANPVTVTNRFGRRLLLFGRGNEEKDIRDKFKKALAFLGRSSAVDVLLRAMVRIQEQQLLGAYSLPILENHDECCYGFPADTAESLALRAKQEFELAVPELDDISLPAEFGLGRSWADAH